MDSFDKKISDLYNADQPSNDLPEGFGWDEMNEGIYEKMEQPKKKRKFLWMWFTFGSSAVLLSVLFFFFSNGTENKQISTTNTTTEIAKTKKEFNPINSDKTLIENSEVFTEKIETTLTLNKKEDNKTVVNHQAHLGLNHKQTTPLGEHALRLTSSPQDANLTNKKPEFMTESSHLETSVSGAAIPSNINVLAVPELGTTPTNSASPFSVTKMVTLLSPRDFTITTKNRPAPSIIKQEPSNLDQTTITKDGEDETSKNKAEFAVSFSPHIYGGTLLTSGKYSQNQQRNKHSKWLPGYYAGIEFTVLNYKKWSINLGYEHKFAVQRFDFQNITDFIDVVVEDSVTSITTNSINGTTTQNRQTITTRASRTRNYINYNTFRSHAFRVTLSRNFKLSKRLHLIAGMGGSYNFLNQTKGRTIGNDSNTLNYDSENSIYRKQNFGIEGGFSLGYQIGKVSLQGNFWMEKTLDYSMEPIGEIRPVFYKLGVGISRSF